MISKRNAGLSRRFRPQRQFSQLPLRPMQHCRQGPAEKDSKLLTPKMTPPHRILPLGVLPLHPCVAACSIEHPSDMFARCRLPSQADISAIANAHHHVSIASTNPIRTCYLPFVAPSQQGILSRIWRCSHMKRFLP